MFFPFQRTERKALRAKCLALRTVLSAKCKACCRAVVLTVPPLPKLLLSSSTDVGLNRQMWSSFNKALLGLSTNRFNVVDLEPYFLQDGVIAEDCFERYVVMVYHVVQWRHCSGLNSKQRKLISGIASDCRFMGSNRRPDRIHINEKGMTAVVKAISSLPPFNP